ncbi:TraB/GumN family protein [Luteimonas sp. 22616]|uniref:TraB/GumN family protein n=1 Tax=Luteimonas sp. 22616 TaxID=3453951 RepID=UPI003F85B6C7
MRLIFRHLALLACLAVWPAHAQSASPLQATSPEPDGKATSPAAAAQDPAAIVDMDTVVVSGAQPGPSMWKVSKGDHVLYILGTLSPLPKRMEWMSREVEDTIARSQAVIAPPSVVMKADVGFFRGLMLVPALLRARNNPDGKKLREVVSPKLYMRWEVLKARYMGRDRGVEKRRPILAAQELYEAAMRKSGLTLDDVVGKAARKAAKLADVPVVPVEATLVIDDPKAALKEFNKSTLDDTECFARTMARIETDLDNMRARANAWATGDIEALRTLPSHNQYAACVDAITETGLAKRLGIADLPKRAGDAWIAAAERALADNQTTFAMLPVAGIMAPDGFLERLRAMGYEVQAP